MSASARVRLGELRCTEGGYVFLTVCQQPLTAQAMPTFGVSCVMVGGDGTTDVQYLHARYVSAARLLCEP